MGDKQITLFDRDADYLESNVSDLNSNHATFRVHASLIYKLGESLIADDVTALSELIKNAYDADATICMLSIDSAYEECIGDETRRGLIEIVDNGCGMDLSTIVNGWLTLSNSSKKKMKKERRTTPKFHRYPLGDKGLGRLSVQKLGRQMELITKSQSSSVEYQVKIPWGDFLKNTTIDQIQVDVQEHEVMSDESYTRIIIKDLIDSEKWATSEQINLLTNSISKIVSPFKSEESSFRVVAQINGQVLESANEVFEEILSSARAKHSIKYIRGKAQIISEFKNAFFYNRRVLDHVLSGNFTLNESAITDFFKTYKGKLHGATPLMKGGVAIEAKNDVDILDYSGMSDPGDFECEIYEYSFDSRLLDYLYENIAIGHLVDREEYRDFIERFHGIKVVRDGFVIQGLGEGEGGDWLGVTSQSKTTGYYIDLRNDSIIGCVFLSGEKNVVLKETTNREGFIEDEYFRGLKYILVESIKRINKTRKVLNDSMSEYVVKSIAHLAKPSEDILNYKSAVERIKQELDTADLMATQKESEFKTVAQKYKHAIDQLYASELVSDETSKTLNDVHRTIQAATEEYSSMLLERDELRRQLDVIVLDFEKMNERIRDLFELAGLGISVEMFSHEFDTSVRNMREKSIAIVKSKEIQNVESLIRHINYLTYSLEALRKQMSYFNPGLKFIRAEKQIFSIKEFLEAHKEFYYERCKNKGIKFILDVDVDFEVRLNRGMLNQVFDNLFSNAEYWLNYSTEHGLIEEKHYNISVPEKGIILVWDNGIGISQDIEDRLFEPFETKKPDGRGLGLYIAAGNLKYSSSRIRLLGERNEFGNIYKFEVDLTQMMQ